MKSIFLPLCALGFVAMTSTAFADDDRQGRRGPPEAAFEACVGLAAESVCNITLRDGVEVSGQCLTPPRLDRAVCVPDDHRKDGGEPREPRDGASDRL